MPSHRHLAALCLTLISAVGIAGAPALALDLGGHVRDGTVVGVTMGAGWSKLEYTPSGGGKTTTGTESAFSGGARVGWAKSDNLIYSLGMYGWKRSYGGTGASVSALHFLAEVSWFPRGEGFWLRGGIGGGSLDLTIYLPGPGPVSERKGGWNYALGAGYEFRVSDGTAIGLCYDFRYVDIGGFAGIESAASLSHNASLNIHFYM